MTFALFLLQIIIIHLQCFTSSYLLPTQKLVKKMRSSAQTLHQGGRQPLPEELLSSLHTLLRNELATVTGNNDFDYTGHDLSLLVLSCVSDAIESYCGITNINAPFFGLDQEVQHRIQSRRRELLLKHNKGYESVKDIEREIENSRKVWVRDVLGSKAAKNYHFGEVTTKAGNKHTHRDEEKKKEEQARLLSNLLSIHV